VRFARNGRYVETDAVLRQGDELAVIPPVAGGAEGETSGAAQDAAADDPREEGIRRLEVRADPIDDALVGSLRRQVASPADGAVVLFVGQTRESPGTPAPGQEADAARVAGQRVEGLAYEAFEPMVLAVLDEIAAEIAARFDVRRLAIVHRVGEVPVGEASVAIAAAAPHRGAAFEACRYAIEELKARAPIWKEERYASGGVWIGAPARARPSDPRPDPGRASSPARG
jgi:molybdopterin synthase catalytic subunit